MQLRLSLLFLAFIVFVLSAFADESPTGSTPTRVFMNDSGTCFAHSVPGKLYGLGGEGGKTDVYVSGEELELVNDYNWYSPKIFIECDIENDQGERGPLVVMTGPWSIGREPTEDDLALAFYHNGQLIRRFSTLDIAERDKKNASCSSSHYRVVSEYLGFASNPWNANDLNFRLRTVDGRELIFDAHLGEIIQTKKSTPDDIFGQCSD